MELLDSPCVGERPRPLFFGSADLLFSFSIFLRGWSSSVAGATDGVFATTSAWSGSVAGDAESSSLHDTAPSVFSMIYLSTRRVFLISMSRLGVLELRRLGADDGPVQNWFERGTRRTGRGQAAFVLHPARPVGRPVPLCDSRRTALQRDLGNLSKIAHCSLLTAAARRQAILPWRKLFNFEQFAISGGFRICGRVEEGEH